MSTIVNLPIGLVGELWTHGHLDSWKVYVQRNSWHVRLHSVAIRSRDTLCLPTSGWSLFAQGWERYGKVPRHKHHHPQPFTPHQLPSLSPDSNQGRGAEEQCQKLRGSEKRGSFRLLSHRTRCVVRGWLDSSSTPTSLAQLGPSFTQMNILPQPLLRLLQHRSL